MAVAGPNRLRTVLPLFAAAEAPPVVVAVAMQLLAVGMAGEVPHTVAVVAVRGPAAVAAAVKALSGSQRPVEAMVLAAAAAGTTTMTQVCVLLTSWLQCDDRLKLVVQGPL